MRISIAGPVFLLTSMIVAGCSGGFGGPKPAQPVQAVDPNTVPQNYRIQVAQFLVTQLADRDDYRSAMIGVPTLKPVATSQRMVVCLQFTRRTEHRDKVVIYLAGAIQQYVDSTPQQCGDATYQPFQELLELLPRR